jgi:hypothetical protein
VAGCAGLYPACEKVKAEKHFCSSALYPEEYLFSNQFMEDLERICRLRKYFPSFEEPKKGLYHYDY